jgi:hypothetical protein
MTEGKFKERLEALTESSNSSLDPDAEDDVKQIIEEAKEEYPTHQEAKTELTKRIGHEWNDGLGAAAVHQILTELRDTWFKKWFGESPP